MNRKPSGPSKALKLGSKNRDVESFVDKLTSEGEKVASLNQANSNNSVMGGNKNALSPASSSSATLPNTEK